LYELNGRLLIVATDRISAFDFVLPTGIPGKGKVLTQLSVFWFDLLRPIALSHFVSAEVETYPEALHEFREQLEGRSMLVTRAEPFPIECVVRGYLSGSGWKDYVGSGSVCGIKLPAGLRQSEELPEPIFTPATKSASGHDENISFDEVVRRIGAARAETLRALSLKIYSRAVSHAAERGILIADTKFEFGRRAGPEGSHSEPEEEDIILIDEVLTPDSSRFWPRDGYAPGRPQPSFDKQFVRDYLEQIRWNKQPPAPPLPDDVVEVTSSRYREALRRLTGRDLDS
jgi:phosphoribosylaminoimidazole-succinocarboxamide synthase